ncbi:MAG: YdbL family protein [Sphingobium sp.]
MTRKTLIIAAALGVIATGLVLSGPARAQTGVIVAAMTNGTVGEQSDGYLGIAGTASADVRSEVEAINIKRRAAYTDLAAKRGVTVADAAVATGCQTLANRVKPGQVYRIGAGAWQTRSAGAITLPGYCSTAG